ncbi:hypothetical protein ACWGQ5_41465 [Streptomyces sp. NPDC055722]
MRASTATASAVPCRASPITIFRDGATKGLQGGLVVLVVAIMTAVQPI